MYIYIGFTAYIYIYMPLYVKPMYEYICIYIYIYIYINLSSQPPPHIDHFPYINRFIWVQNDRPYNNTLVTTF